MSDVSPDDLTARLRLQADRFRNRLGVWGVSTDITEAADLIDALSADVARLTEGLAQRTTQRDEARANLSEAWAIVHPLRRERDEALARVAEHAATIDTAKEIIRRLLGGSTPLWKVGRWRRYVGKKVGNSVMPEEVIDDMTPAEVEIVRSVLADTAPTPETHIDHKTGPCKSCGTSWADCPDNEDADTEFAGCCYGCAHPCEGSR